MSRPAPRKTSASGWPAWVEAKRPVFLFGLKFGALVLLLYVLLALPLGDRLLYGYLEFYAWLTHLVLHLLGQPTQLSGINLQSPRFSVTIERGCDAVEPTWLVLAAVITSPATWRSRLAGIAVAVLLLQVLNLVRILTLYFVGAYCPAFFNPVHLEIWPAVFLLTAVGLFLAWRQRAATASA